MISTRYVVQLPQPEADELVDNPTFPWITPVDPPNGPEGPVLMCSAASASRALVAPRLPVWCPCVRNQEGDPLSAWSDPHIAVPSQNLRPALYYAAINGRPNELAAALTRGADLGWTDLGKGRSALWVAAYYGEEECLRLLVEAGAGVDQSNLNGATPLWVACQGGYAGCTRRLLAAGVSSNKPSESGVDWPSTETKRAEDSCHHP